MIERDVEQLVHLFDKHRKEDQAIPMQRYMKDHFSFLGIKTPERKELLRQFFSETNLLKTPFQREFVWRLWELEEREFQYAALHYLDKHVTKMNKEELPFMEKLITTKSWWDTVDMLAQKQVGTIVQKHPEWIVEKLNQWAVSENLWLRRSAILFQLKYKDQTDEQLLYHYIKLNAGSKEFFIQKAIGWALREYSKTNPNSVKDFIATNELSKLSIREGSKYI
ncbi:DNA alkylation repair protein [Cytobacillus spongiae]|jgi:3-methyladenine DNA glycosylase AlkD|uniref:DNA alkylation repair protein n=1 Tax=Cytobacillus spongiae TaxID=2901381 RepID=UPI001F43D8A2|nr:DNA alkylation repair protein [Cytobacillus spongiae]UII55831.1 DNA alkylation repair protein [Cytobacillus spongiae]